MARFARIVLPGVAHHVTQRGNRRQPVFFSDADRRRYLDLVRQEQATDRRLRPAKRGPKAKASEEV
jgi:REP element-mobilizing transposase RayT